MTPAQADNTLRIDQRIDRQDRALQTRHNASAFRGDWKELMRFLKLELADD